MSDLKFDENKPRNPIMIIWENLEMSICFASMLGLTVITFINVFLRYVLGSSIPWSEEVCGFLIIWLTFGGSAYAFRMGAHIGIDSLVNRLKPKARHIVTILNKISVIVFFGIVGYFGYKYAIIQANQLTPITRISASVPISAVPVGSVMIISRVLYQLAEQIKTGVKEV